MSAVNHAPHWTETRIPCQSRCWIIMSPSRMLVTTKTLRIRYQNQARISSCPAAAARRVSIRRCLAKWSRLSTSTAASSLIECSRIEWIDKWPWTGRTDVGWEAQVPLHEEHFYLCPIEVCSDRGLWSSSGSISGLYSRLNSGQSI